MRTYYSIVIFAVFMFACGGTNDAPTECVGTQCESPQQVRLWVEVHNSTSKTRACHVSASYETDASGATEVISDDASLSPDEILYEDEFSVRTGTTVSIAVGCWDPREPDSEEGRIEVYRRAVTQDETCRATYGENNGLPHVEFLCWYGRL